MAKYNVTTLNNIKEIKMQKCISSVGGLLYNNNHEVGESQVSYGHEVCNGSLNKEELTREKRRR